MKTNYLVFKSDPENIHLVKKWLDDLTEKLNIGQEIYPNILISLTEAVNNAIQHGNKCDCTKSIQLYCFKKHDRLKFKVIDEGEGFDCNKIPDPRTKDKIECENGRGVLIMKSLAHKVKYNNQGTNVVITFKISSNTNG
ncbi:MAG: ATP-binding protein [Saprospiraceae bacterium]